MAIKRRSSNKKKNIGLNSEIGETSKLNDDVSTDQGNNNEGMYGKDIGDTGEKDTEFRIEEGMKVGQSECATHEKVQNDSLEKGNYEKGSSAKSTTGEASISDVSKNEYVNKDANCKQSIVRENKDIVNEISGNKENDKKDVNFGTNTFASIVKKSNIMEQNKLKFIPTVINEDGNEVVIFDEELVNIGSQKWKLALCGYLVGFKMILPELRYHLRRMWWKYGLEDIVDSGQGKWIFKFRNEAGLNEVLRSGPWMVNGKPLIVNKWNPEMGFEKVDHDKLPVWVKLSNIPLEAWSVDGLSAISSSLGMPITMDNMSAHVCKVGIGRTEYARVLVEMDANKDFKDQVEVQYRDKENQVKGVKRVTVEYEWKPDVCSHCRVFGHEYGVCNKREKTLEEKKLEEDKKKENARGAGEFGQQKQWNIVRNKRWKENSFMANKWMPKQNQSVRNGEKENNNKEISKPKQNQSVRNEEKENSNKETSKQKIYEEEYPEFNAQSRKCESSSCTINSAVLENEEKIDVLQRAVVDGFLNMRRKPKDKDLKEWSLEMMNYFCKRGREMYPAGY